jgi:phosphoglycolate phosphatase-like HAD superfamily hydrolase
VNHKSLIMFDVDGTLCRTHALDGSLFVRALRDLVGPAEIDDDWSAYRHVTDRGIAAEVITRLQGRPASHAELDRLQARFAELLEETLTADPEACREIEGAAALVAHLRAEGWPLAIATGGFGVTARRKMGVAGIPFEDLPMASSEDALSREEIMAQALERAGRHYEVANFEAVLYLGDGVWDLQASRNSGFAFVGVGEGPRAQLLRDLGADPVLPHFGCLETSLAGLRAALRHFVA